MFNQSHILKTSIALILMYRGGGDMFTYRFPGYREGLRYVLFSSSYKKRGMKYCTCKLLTHIHGIL